MKVLIWNSLSSRKRKLIGWAAGLVLFYAVLGFLILPPIVRSVAVKQLSRQLDREVSIQSVKINPFALSTSIRGLLIKDKDGEPFVSWDEVYVNFQLSSLFGRAWTFREISTTRPHLRAVMNRDGTFNFTDIVQKFSTNAAPAESARETRPLILRVGHLHIEGATAAIADFTPRTPFKRVLGPLDITLDNFRTDPDNKNPYAFSGTTDAGETIAWSGHFYLNPLHSEGRLRLFNFTINKYAPLYQDLVRFEIRDGIVALSLNYNMDFNPTNRVLAVTDSAIGLRDFKLGQLGDSNNILELPALAIAGASADVQTRQATIGSIVADGARVNLLRNKDAAINVLELSKPAATAGSAPDGILLLLQSLTNVVTKLIASTNQWSGAIRDVSVTNCAVHLEDDVNSRPATLDLADVALSAKNLSNLPGTNLDAALSLRWNTNGSIKVAASASFLPPTADVRIDLDQLDLGTLDPYLEPKLDLFILGSKVGLHGTASLRTVGGALPEVTFKGSASLDDFRTVDGALGEDLVKWRGVHFNDIEANLNPQTVAIREIVLDGVNARLIIETNKTINLLNVLRLTKPVSPATNETQVAAAQPASGDARPAGATNAPLPKISIGAVVFTNNDFSFTDRSLKSPVNLSIRDFGGSVASISTEQMGHANLDLAAKVDGVGPVTITGVINPFDDTQTNTLKITLKDMDLTPASPYAGKFAGYRIAQGKLNLELAYQIVGKKLDSQNVITIDQFNFGEKVESPDATKLPVRLAVALLKDRDGKIVLDVPIEGRLDDPKFRIGRVVTRTLLNLLEKAATSPFSLLGAVIGGGGEELGWQEFAPGSAQLTEDGKKKLDSLQKALFARPALRLEIAGGIDPEADREGLQRAALDRDIRARLWKKLDPAERKTASADEIILSPADRAAWVKKIYDEAVTAGKINAEFIAANTNLATLAAEVLPKASRAQKGASLLQQRNATESKSAPAAAAPVYQTKLVPPPDAFEAVLLATIPVSDEDFESLAAQRAKNVEDYLIESGKLETSRLFLKTSQMENLRKDGCRAWLQLQ
jgi:hypothetical protein